MGQVFFDDISPIHHHREDVSIHPYCLSPQPLFLYLYPPPLYLYWKSMDAPPPLNENPTTDAPPPITEAPHQRSFSSTFQLFIPFSIPVWVSTWWYSSIWCSSSVASPVWCFSPIWCSSSILSCRHDNAPTSDSDVALNQSAYSGASQFQHRRDSMNTEDKRLISTHIFMNFTIFRSSIVFFEFINL